MEENVQNQWKFALYDVTLWHNGVENSEKVKIVK